MRDKRLINIIGKILMLLSFAFIINRITDYQIDFGQIPFIRVLVILIISIIIYAFMVVALANMFYALVKLLGNNKISRKNSIIIYCRSNLYKYLPGNIFHYVGRNQIAVEEEISHGTIATATIAEMLFLALAAIISAIAFAGPFTVGWLLAYCTGKEVITVLAFFVIIGLAIRSLYRLNSHVKAWSIRYTKQINHIKLTDSSKFIIAYILTFIINGAMFIMILYSLGGELSNNLILPVIGMYAFSWMISFATPGAPAGLGIREAIMSTLLMGIVDGGLVITAVVLYRIVTILGDIVGFIIAHQYKETQQICRESDN